MIDQGLGGPSLEIVGWWMESPDAECLVLLILQYGELTMSQVGMRCFHKQQNHFWNPTVNLDKLVSLIPEETRVEYLAGKKTDTVPVLDLLPLGYSKVLGKGRLP